MLEFNDLINNCMIVGHVIKKVKRITSPNVCEIKSCKLNACHSLLFYLLKDGLLDCPSY